MARYTGAVRFSDQSLMYFVYEGTVDTARRQLYRDESDAFAAWDDESEPAKLDACTDDEAVEVMPYYCHENQAVEFMSRASKSKMVITGPCDFESWIEERERDRW